MTLQISRLDRAAAAGAGASSLQSRIEASVKSSFAAQHPEWTLTEGSLQIADSGGLTNGIWAGRLSATKNATGESATFGITHIPWSEVGQHKDQTWFKKQGGPQMQRPGA